MSKFTSKDNQNMHYKSQQSLNDAKKRKLENVNQNLLNGDSNSVNNKGHSFVNLTKTTAINDDEVLQKYHDVAVLG